ncbi:hypothetical protein ACFC58_24090 [Kitasatospora purpeofusca]
MPTGLEHVTGGESTLDDTVARILTDTAPTPPGWTPLLRTGGRASRPVTW